MPDLGPVTPLMAATTDDLDAQCRGIGTCASARDAHRAGPRSGAGVSADLPLAWPAGGYGDGLAARDLAARDLAARETSRAR